MPQVKFTTDSATPLPDDMLRALERADSVVADELASLREGFDVGSEWRAGDGQACVRLVAAGDTPAEVTSEPIPLPVLENDVALKRALNPIFIRFARALLEASRVHHRSRWDELRREWKLLEAEVAVEA